MRRFCFSRNAATPSRKSAVSRTSHSPPAPPRSLHPATPGSAPPAAPSSPASTAGLFSFSNRASASALRFQLHPPPSPHSPAPAAAPPPPRTAAPSAAAPAPACPRSAASGNADTSAGTNPIRTSVYPNFTPGAASVRVADRRQPRPTRNRRTLHHRNRRLRQFIQRPKHPRHPLPHPPQLRLRPIRQSPADAVISSPRKTPLPLPPTPPPGNSAPSPRISPAPTINSSCISGVIAFRRVRPIQQ